jgi:hypothetical protein
MKAFIIFFSLFLANTAFASGEMEYEDCDHHNLHACEKDGEDDLRNLNDQYKEEIKHLTKIILAKMHLENQAALKRAEERRLKEEEERKQRAIELHLASIQQPQQLDPLHAPQGSSSNTEVVGEDDFDLNCGLVSSQ